MADKRDHEDDAVEALVEKAKEFIKLKGSVTRKELVAELGTSKDGVLTNKVAAAVVKCRGYSNDGKKFEYIEPSQYL